MCGPLLLLGASTAMSAAGSIFGGMQANNQAQYAAQVAENNATYAQRQAADALERGDKANLEHYRKVSQLRGTQIAAMSAGGIGVGYGSSGDILNDTAILGNADAETIRQNAENEAQGYRISAQNYRSQATADRASGKSALFGSFLGAGSTILGGASRIAYMNAKPKIPLYGAP